MSGMTATQFYSYPTGTDAPCDAPVALKAMVDQIDAALAAMRASIVRAKNPPMVILEYNPPAPVSTLGLTINWNTVICDSGGFFDPGVPSIVTLPAGGRYLVGMSATYNDGASRLDLGVNSSAEASMVALGTNTAEDRGGSMARFVVADTDIVRLTPGTDSVSGTASLKWARFWAFLAADYS